MRKRSVRESPTTRSTFPRYSFGRMPPCCRAYAWSACLPATSHAYDESHGHRVAENGVEMAHTRVDDAVGGVEHVAVGADGLATALLELLVAQLSTQQLDQRVHQVDVSLQLRRTFRRPALRVDRALHYLLTPKRRRPACAVMLCSVYRSASHSRLLCRIRVYRSAYRR